MMVISIVDRGSNNELEINGLEVRRKCWHCHRKAYMSRLSELDVSMCWVWESSEPWSDGLVDLILIEASVNSGSLGPNADIILSRTLHYEHLVQSERSWAHFVDGAFDRAKLDHAVSSKLQLGCKCRAHDNAG